MDLVVIHNDFNNVNLTGLKEKELDLLISLCYKLKDEGIDEIKLAFDELKKLSKYEDRHIERFVKDLDNVYKKLIELNFRYEDENKIIRFVLFKSYEIDKNKKNVTISVNEKFKYILNELTGNFTRFELNQFVSLNSQYAKHIFRLLKQFNGTGWREFLLSDFRNKLGIPEKYRISEIDKYILNGKIIEELKKSFTNLRVLKIKKGREVDKIRFEWDVLTLLPPSKEEEKKSKEKLIENQTEYEEKLNKKTKKEKIKITQYEFGEKFRKFVEDNDADPTDQILLKTFAKPYEIIKDEKIFQEEPQEILGETKQSFEVPLFIIPPETEAEIEAKKFIEIHLPFLLSEGIIDEDIEFACAHLERKKMFKELELVKLFFKINNSPVVDENIIFKDEKCLGLTDFGKNYIENYIKEHNLEYLLVSEKTKKEIKGSARESRLVKLYKNDFKIN